jgi:hypothetical protein
MFRRWLTTLTERIASTLRSRRPRVAASRLRAQQEHRLAVAADVLEDRTMLTVITVTSLSDEDNVDDSPVDPNFDGTQFDATDNGPIGSLTLREAIEIANRNQNSGNGGGEAAPGVTDIIRFAPGLNGTIILTSELPTITDGVLIDALTNNNSITITGDVGNDNDIANNVRIVTIATANDDTVTFRGNNTSTLTFQEGNARNGVNDDGGAILITSNGAVVFEDCLIQDSRANRDGGGIAWTNGGPLGSVTLTDTNVTGNVADGDDSSDGGGGGLYVNGGFVRLQENTGDETLFNGNTAIVGGAIQLENGTIEIEAGVVLSGNGGINTVMGGAIAATGGTRASGQIEHLNIDGGAGAGAQVTFSGNEADRGGGIFTGPNIFMDIEFADFINNEAEGPLASDGGGAIYMNNPDEVDIDNALFSQNGADGALGRGGAIFSVVRNDSVAPLRPRVAITNSVMIENNAHSGGAVHHEATAAGQNTARMQLNNIDFDSNIALVDGGAVHASVDGVVEINSTDMHENVAGVIVDGTGRGGGVYNSDSVQLNINSGSIRLNVAHGSDLSEGGGGIYNDGAGNLGAITNINSVDIFDNTAIQGSASGGGVFNSAGGTVNITNDSLVFNNDAAQNGGGVNNLGTLTINDSDIGSVNTAVQGAGVFNGSTGVATISNNSDLDGNDATQSGGGLFNDTNGRVDISDSSVDGNDAFGNVAGQGGGGIYNRGRLFVQRSSINDNGLDLGGGADSDPFGGGGILNAQGGLATLVSSSLTNNEAEFGGGYRNENVSVLTLIDTTINFNDANTRGGGGDQTGGVVALDDGLTQDNVAATAGGGLSNVGGTLIVTNAPIVRNTATGDSGGGIFNDGGVTQISNSTITLNAANGVGAGDGGGGIFNNGLMIVTDTNVTANVATAVTADGGGILNTTNGNLTLNRGSVAGNVAGRSGGGIANNDGAFVIQDANVVGNIAAVNGGGMLLVGTGSSLTLNGGAFRNNTAGEEGGGIWTEGTLDVNDVVIDGNTASGDLAGQGGGGIFSEGGDVTVTDSDITNNAANGILGSGGGILASAGTLSVTNTNISNNEAEQSGGGIELLNVTTDVTLTDVTLDNNSALGTDVTATGDGGGLHVSGATNVDIDGGSVSGNDAAEEGGGIWNGTGTLTLTNNVTVDNNTASGPGPDQGGGGIFNAGGTVDITGGTISGNDADGTEGSGGGILNDADGDVTITGTVIDGNTAVRAGGGIETTGGTEVDLFNVTLTNNDATGAGAGHGEGGGAHITGDGILEIEGGVVNDNHAEREGGGLWNSGTGTMSLFEVTVSNNTADFEGGGIFQDGIAAAGILNITKSTIDNNDAINGAGLLIEEGVVTIETSTISTNAATAVGGGIRVVDGVVNLLSTTIAANTATAVGGGISQAAGTINSTSTLIGDNTAAVSPDLAGTINGDYNLVENTAGATVNGANNLLGIAPGLDPLDDYGGPTRTHRLQFNSAALDQGVDAPGLGEDQRGENRPFDSGAADPPGGDGSDIGAFESQVGPVQLVGLDGGSTLVVFFDTGPGAAVQVPILGLNPAQGLVPAENAIAIDARLSDHEVYIVTDHNRILRVNATTGQTTFVSNLSIGVNDAQASAASGLDDNRDFFISDTGFFENFLGLGEKWIKGNDIEATGNPWYYIMPDGRLFKSGGGEILIARLGSNVHDNPELLVNAFPAFASLPLIDRTNLQTADQTNRFFRASSGDFFTNFFGQNEKWFKGNTNVNGNPWYFITPDGVIRAQNATFATSQIITTVNAEAWEDPTVLTTAFDNIAALSPADQTEAVTEDTNRDFFFYPKGNLRENLLGLNEKHFRGDDVVGNAGADYYITPNGDVFRNGTPGALFNVGPNAWDNLELLVNADDPFADLPGASQTLVSQIDFERGLLRRTNTAPPSDGFSFNASGQQEKWLWGDVNEFGNNWYAIRTNGDIIAWNGGAGVNGTLLGNAGVDVYENPEALFEAYDRQALLGTTQLLAGTEAGMDFNNDAGQVLFRSVADTLRLVVDQAGNLNDANLLIDPATGLTQLVSDLPGPTQFSPDVAWNGNAPALPSTTLYSIDFSNDTLNTMNPATGALTLVGNLNAGANFTDGGLEIIRVDNSDRALAVLKVAGAPNESRLYVINLTTGQATALGPANGLIGTLGVFDDIHGVTISKAALDILFGPP